MSRSLYKDTSKLSPEMIERSEESKVPLIYQKLGNLNDFAAMNVNSFVADPNFVTEAQDQDSNDDLETNLREVKEDLGSKIAEICSQKRLPEKFTLKDLKVLDQFIAEKGKDYLFERSYNWYNIYYTVTSPFRKQENLEITFNPREVVRVRAEAQDKVPEHMVSFKKHCQRGPYSHLLVGSSQIPKGTILIKKVVFAGDLYDQGWGLSSYSGLLCYTRTPEISFYDDLVVIDRFRNIERNYNITYEGQNMLRLQKIPAEDSKLEIYLNSPPFPNWAAETKGFTLTLTLIKNEYVE